MIPSTRLASLSPQLNSILCVSDQTAPLHLYIFKSIFFILFFLYIMNKFFCYNLQDAADLGAKVAVLDYVKPSEKGTTWGKYPHHTWTPLGLGENIHPI